MMNKSCDSHEIWHTYTKNAQANESKIISIVIAFMSKPKVIYWAHFDIERNAYD